MTKNILAVSGKTAIVTGASSGLGAHFAVTLANHGARVVLAARRLDRLEAIVADLGAERAMAVAMDVADRDAIEAALAAAEARFGAPDILINNAGVADTQRFLDVTDESWQRIIDVNLTGVFRVGQAVARRMAAAGKGGAIVNISSVLALVVQPTQAAYAASKAAVAHLTRAMARELGRERIRVNAIAPGYFLTEMNEAFFATERGQMLAKSLFPRRAGELHELDGALLLLASDAGSFINGTLLTVDGGTLLSGV